MGQTDSLIRSAVSAFNAGSPDTAPASVLKRVTERSAAGLEKRRQIVDAALRAMSR